ncbi:MAG: hypothetical protein A4E50_01138 [Methanosaeta sp. PtaB.Bin087]|nr:MAG: hypothetical protein A4E50_01138 [Methanosaeta sp. PtaB.Bin087]OPY49061.1 MAG: hypothetical protein A4E51_02071 [Methanosaeta sp. PtaU1.Bin055]
MFQATLASRLAVCLNICFPMASPKAQIPSRLVSIRSSTTIQPERSTSTPDLSGFRMSEFGLLPRATITSSAANSRTASAARSKAETTFLPPFTSTFTASVPVLMSTYSPSLFLTISEISGSSPLRSCSFLPTIVTSVPRAEKKWPYSQAM